MPLYVNNLHTKKSPKALTNMIDWVLSDAYVVLKIIQRRSSRNIILYSKKKFSKQGYISCRLISLLSEPF